MTLRRRVVRQRSYCFIFRHSVVLAQPSCSAAVLRRPCAFTRASIMSWRSTVAQLDPFALTAFSRPVVEPVCVTSFSPPTPGCDSLSDK